MKQRPNILRGRPWLMLLLLAWLLPQQAAAATYVDKPENYSVSLGGSNIVYFTAPVYDTDDNDCWVTAGNLKVSVEGGTPYNIFYWESEKNINNSNTTLQCKFSTETDGFFDITLGNSRSTSRLTKSNGGWRTLTRNSDGLTFEFSAEWVVPYNLLGKTLHFSWDVERDGNGRSKEKVSGLKEVTIKMPAASAKLKPFVSMPMLNPSNPGKLELPWLLASDSIVSAYYEYDDAWGTHHKENINNIAGGTIELDANVPHRNFRLVCSYKEVGDKGSYLIEGVSTTPQNIALIHSPIGLTVRPFIDKKAKVELSWNVPYQEDEDMTPTDFFEIQRSLTGKEADFVTIGQEFYAKTKKQSTYTFVDSTLIDDVTASMLTGGGTLDKLTYRVRRAITQEWGWDHNCAASASCVVDRLHLLRIADYSAKWEDERAYSVRVSWNYEDEHGAIWDDRAKMMLRVVSRNREGATVDSLTFQLDDNDRAQRYKIVNLTRSCVYYNIDMYVERNESPINFLDQTEEYFFPIRNASDWVEFKNRVQVAGGKYDVNARLYADITTGESISWESSYAYRGIFDGNGHTITFNLADTGQECLAPFRFVGNATFRNLHTTGTITSSQSHSSGLIGQIDPNCNVTIDGCRSSVTIKSSVDGNTANGGFVSIVNTGATVTFRNCKFDGSFEGANCSHNGGYVGYTNGAVIVDNCLFTPERISTKSDGCQTWARVGTGSLTIINSYATREYSAFIAIRNANDWKTFQTMVENAKNLYDVDAVLQADITTSDYVGGGEAAYYRGTFDGNGHTITFNKSGFSENYIGLFRHAGNATIKNLHVNGTIKTTGQYAGGLIGNVVNGNNVSIENCRSSMTINTTNRTNGGFISRLGDNSTATIRNCKFDGSFEGSESQSNGGFIGYCQDNSTATLENCLFEPDHLSTKFAACETWARKSESAKVTVTNSEAITHYSPSSIIIRSEDDWDKFGQLVKESNNTYWVDAILQADISVKKSVGFSDAPWRGTLHGNGHTITIDIESDNNSSAALFTQVSDVTITDLHVTGTVKGGIHSAGLIGGTTGGTPTITLNHVWVSTEVNCSSTHAGGIIGHSTYSNVNMNDVLFDGKVNTNNADNSYVGEIIGWCDGGSWFLKRVYDNGWPKAHWMFFCLDRGSSWGTNNGSYTVTRHGWDNVDQHNKTDQSEVVSLMNDREAGTWQLVNGNAVPVMQTTEKYLTAAQLVETLGKDNWTVVDGKAVPKKASAVVSETSLDDLLAKLGSSWVKEGETINPKTTSEPYKDYRTIPDPNLKGLFYHKNTGTIDPTLLTTTRQSSVLLAWNTDGKPIDYFKVMRRVQGEDDDAWQEVATDLDQMSYEDKTVSPLVTYEYKVLAVNDCEGITTTETQVKVGECKHTGRVEGYVRFNDGTSAPDVSVSIYHVVGDEKTFVKNVVTDESGFFEADELSYYGGESANYKVAPVAETGVKYEVDDYSVTFNAHSNNETVHEFIITNGRRFSGYVMYDGTSIPVKGANFLVNGRKRYNAKGEVLETDYDGSFSFRVKEGDNKIQAVMDGHTFTNDGYYKNSNAQNISSDVSNIYFYDATKVKLTGRIVGGDVQGKLPLDNNLSTNNLGDSIQMVLTLEGDNTSWLVYDNLNPNRTQREEVFRHKQGGNKHYTSVKVQRKRMEVTPDPTTGEYVLMLPPVRWKVQQVYCKGYPTLFQEGQVSEVVDLTDCLVSKDTTYVGEYKDVDNQTIQAPTATYNAVYNRIYHSPVEVTYRQLSFDTFDYFGDREYMATELNGETAQVPLAYKNPADTTKALYSFGFPVFSVERKYNIQLQVAEHYLYNNDPARKPDLVPLGGGTAYMQNGMNDGALLKEPMQLDSLGQATFVVKANMTTTLLTGLNALKTVTFSVEQNGNHYDAEPLHGYVLNMFPVGNSQDILTDGTPILYDILRDPPGAYSSNTLAKGTTLNYTYMMNMSLTAGVYFNYKGGTKLQTITATVSAPQGIGTSMGPINNADTWDADVDFLMYNAQGTKAFSHTMVVGNNISTSSDPSMVGADADLYIGSVQNVVVTPMSTIRAVTKKMFNEIAARQGTGAMPSEVGKYDEYGTLVKIAEGEKVYFDKDMKEKRDTFYLIRDVALGYGPKIQSEFIYSQKQLLTQIIPAKAKEIVDLMYCGTKAEAQSIANNTQEPVYLSLRLPTDSAFAVVNSKKPEGHAYNTKIEEAEKGINYLIVLPTDADESKYSDQVAEKYQVIKAWIDMIARNEGEKLSAHDLLTNYDVAGAAGVNYSETFDASFSNSFTQHFPIATEVDYFGQGEGVSNAYSAAGLAGTLISGIVLSLAEMKTWNTPDAINSGGNSNNGMQSEINFSGKTAQWTLVPVVAYTTIGSDAETKGYNRTETFTIACDPYSHLNVDVYRAKYYTNDKETVPVYDIFTNDNFNKMYDEVKNKVDKSLKSVNITGPHSFIFRTRGGSTQNPWEDKRVTKFYRPGTQLDARTLKIVNPKIRLDKQTVSGVSINDAAHFKVYVSNESEKPEGTDGLTVLQLFSVDQLNTQGARISVNGQVLTTGGMTVTTVPGMETELTMEVRAGQGFDFENLAIGVMSPTDPEHTYALATFDVHFLREAGDVNIAVPGDKWVLNTNAQMDSERGWYLPVTINGFDRHQHNFDHIEFQYKESQRGDDSWTNLCSFYASDSLMASANGVRKLIPENGNIVTEFYGEGWVMEREYDLRAVLFCRNGSDFLTTSSKIISGIKDTRRPQLFGTPEPKSGLITQGDDIVFNFSEDIEYNYLSAITNFEVKGEVNNDNISDMVSVQFTGQASVETEAKRNFSGKNLTIDLMVKPAETGREMPLFSHGTNGQKLQLWLTEDFRLKAVVNDQTFTSNDAISGNAFRQVALVLNQKDSLLTFYKGGVEMGHYKLNSLYSGTGTLIFGRTNESDRSTSQYYEGKMMEARLWYSAMDGGLIGTTYGSRHLTGYEKDLVDYYPMNEGSGKYATDHTQGANAMLIGADWALPQGYSLSLKKEDKGVLLDQNALNRTSEHDYTLMFWFKTDADGRGTLLSNGRGLKEDNGSENQFHIGFEGDKLVYRSNGFATEVPGDWSDNQWHNYAMTVNRARNVANIYMDKDLKTTFELDSLGGISGGYPLIGATRYDVLKENGDKETKDGDDALTGHVDELLFFAQALPEQLIKTYTTKSPNGDEAGLLTYLSFDRQERQQDNSIELVPYAYSKKLYLDDQGKPRYQLDPMTKEPTDTLVRDYLFVDEMDVVLQHFDQATAAPVVPYEEVKNLKFGFIGKGNQLLVELDEPAAKLHHRNIYVTVRDIEDKNGNAMASPQTACYYVANNSLEWLVNRLDSTIKYGESQSVELPFYNWSASSHTYRIENCPKWLTLDKYTDVIAPLGIDYVKATVSKDLNIGTYNEIIYLTDEEGITEPFYLNLTVEGEQPDWAKGVDSNLLKNSMSISGQVYLYNELDTDSRDIVGVFDEQNVCHGFANLATSSNSADDAGRVYLTVYDNQASGRTLNFRLWQYSTGREIVLTPPDTIKFEKDAILGTDKPVRFDGRDSFIQYFNLEKGWNWLSFNVSSKQLDKVYSLLTTLPLQNGDVLTDLVGPLAVTYTDGQWLSTDNPDTINVSSKNSYAIKVQEPCVIAIGGTVIKDEDERTMNVKQGWNAIGYTPALNLTVETALSDYYDLAETGDVIKSQTEFAYFTKAGNTGRWQGSLKYMKPGEGYMMLHKGSADASFTYPYYEPGSTFLDEMTYAPSRAAASARRAMGHATADSDMLRHHFTMNVCAKVEGFELENGDRLVAYAEGEPCGVATAEVGDKTADDMEPLYLTIGGEKSTGIYFAIERDGDIVALSGEQMTFNANSIVGTPSEPFVISFSDANGIDLVSGDFEQGKWYTVNGVQLSSKPTRPGLYIYNNRKVVIKNKTK